MISAGCDIGSLTAKAVILENGKLLGSEIIRVRPNPVESAETVIDLLLSRLNLEKQDIASLCCTGYGRHEIPFADLQKSEISCHGLGAFHTDPAVRGVIDIGGQDCKVMTLDARGRIENFVMNDKCAAGTGRSLELLARTLGVSIEELSRLAAISLRSIEISNKCSIFMELEVLEAIYRQQKPKRIAAGVCDAVARRVAALANPLGLTGPVCITGGVSKNRGVVRFLKKRIDSDFRRLRIDPQIMGALGAALFAAEAGGQPC